MKSTPSIMKHMALNRSKSPLKKADPGKDGLIGTVGKEIVRGIANAIAPGSTVIYDAITDGNKQKKPSKQGKKLLPKLTEEKGTFHQMTKSFGKLPTNNVANSGRGRKESSAKTSDDNADDEITTEDKIKTRLQNR